ncbi:hypothetical protein AALB_2344 [Agarivorans albus MKT 106]|uniref:Uncharacterized protein n=1 Tax=Agarivorans albus MKT 106 TaxID=1331007 RepID=R9PLM2_AGAAL|nr:hypothetical protein AALB_2344 [Agarivorans albus MKT 106]
MDAPNIRKLVRKVISGLTRWLSFVYSEHFLALYYAKLAKF